MSLTQHLSPDNFWKLNTDAAWHANQGVGGLGWIIRNEKREIKKAGGQTITDARDITYLELMAIWLGIEAVVSSSSVSLIIESESLEAIHLIQGIQQNVTEILWLVQDIKNFGERARLKRFQHVQRDGNSVAQEIANRAADGLVEEN
ncbi:uncharacterized protein LOC111017329 [Momordica charantia]|uniref:Uncharacterized protein LOC111017329 n=1 Tax=Momordica charantia TaxID=3673 RepID=A0A6J1D5W1_MOMCH|nr:uncharacterized protein LOC111017329 [Momordica charantia]